MILKCVYKSPTDYVLFLFLFYYDFCVILHVRPTNNKTFVTRSNIMISIYLPNNDLVVNNILYCNIARVKYNICTIPLQLRNSVVSDDESALFYCTFLKQIMIICSEANITRLIIVSSFSNTAFSSSCKVAAQRCCAELFKTIRSIPNAFIFLVFRF